MPYGPIQIRAEDVCMKDLKQVAWTIFHKINKYIVVNRGLD